MWRAARSLLVLQQQLQRGAPRAAPPATGVDEWGLKGDAAHDSTSDHTPHDFPGWGSQIVTAGDFPNRPEIGLDAHRVLDDIRRSEDPRAKYGISNAQIFSNHRVTQGGQEYPAWTWRPYYGTDLHMTHGHLSVVGDARADGMQPWATIGGPMANAAEINASRNAFAITQLQPKYKVIPGDVDGAPEQEVTNRLATVLGELQAAVSAPAPVVLDAAAEERIAQRMATLVVEQLGALRFVADA